MAVTQSPRLGVTRWGAGTDPLTRAQLDGDHAKLDDLVAISGQGTLAARPAFGVRGRLYFATDTGRLYYDTAAAWLEVVVPGLGHTFTAGQTIEGGNAPGAGSGNTSLRLASSAPTLELHDLDVAAGAAGGRFWVHANGGSLYFLVDDNGDGGWDSPHPLRLDTNGMFLDRRITFRSYRERRHNNGAVAAGGTVTVDPSVATVHLIQADGNITINLAAAADVDSILLRIYMGNAYAVTWPAGLRWAGKEAPALEAGNNLVSLWFEAGIWWGAFAGTAT